MCGRLATPRERRVMNTAGLWSLLLRGMGLLAFPDRGEQMRLKSSLRRACPIYPFLHPWPGLAASHPDTHRAQQPTILVQACRTLGFACVTSTHPEPPAPAPWQRSSRCCPPGWVERERGSEVQQSSTRTHPSFHPNFQPLPGPESTVTGLQEQIYVFQLNAPFLIHPLVEFGRNQVPGNAIKYRETDAGAHSGKRCSRSNPDRSVAIVLVNRFAICSAYGVEEYRP